MSRTKQANEQTDEQVTQNLSLNSWLFWTIVRWENEEKGGEGDIGGRARGKKNEEKGREEVVESK